MHLCCCVAHCAPDGRWSSSGRWSCRWVAKKNKKKAFLPTALLDYTNYFFVCVPTVCAVAQQVLWNCLIEDPALVLRHFLEKLTVSNRQVRSLNKSWFLEKKRWMCCYMMKHMLMFIVLRMSWCTCWGNCFLTLGICLHRPRTFFSTIWWDLSMLFQLLF